MGVDCNVTSDVPVCVCVSVVVCQAVSNHDELMSNFFAQPGTHTTPTSQITTEADGPYLIGDSAIFSIDKR